MGLLAATDHTLSLRLAHTLPDTRQVMLKWHYCWKFDEPIYRKRPMDRVLRSLLSMIAFVALVGVACNLSSSTPPATLAPEARQTDVPLPTLGYSTPSTNDQGTNAPVPTAAPPTGAYLYNMLNQVEAARLMNHIYALEGSYTRHVNSLSSETQGINAAYRYISSQFQAVQEQSRGNFVTFPHPFRSYTNFGGEVQEALVHNVVGVINGTQPNTPAIVIGAHYDSRTDDLSDATGYAPGADDNGSGVAALIEMARILSQVQPRATMIFVAFAAEEVNRQGSSAFVRDYLDAFGIEVKVMINLDTIGSVNDSLGKINDSQLRLFSAGPDDDSPSRQMARMIDFIGDNHQTDLEIVYLSEVDREGRYGDHMSFSEKGIPAVRFIEALEDNVNREGRDTSDKVEPHYLRKSTRTVLTVVMALSDGLDAPQNPVVREMPGGTRRVAWEPVDGATGYVVALRRAGETTFEQLFYADAGATRYECDCFTSALYESFAVAAINTESLMGPLSREVRLP